MKTTVHIASAGPRKQVTCLVAALLLALACSMRAETAQQKKTVCRKPENSAGLSFFDSASTVNSLRSVKAAEGKNAIAKTQLDLRNSGTTDLTRLCVRVYLSDFRDQRRTVPIRLEVVGTQDAEDSHGVACVAHTLAIGEVASLVVTLTIPRNELPVSGILAIDAVGESKDTGGGLACSVQSTPLTRSIAISTWANAKYTLFPIAVFVLTAVPLIVATVFFRERLSETMGGPQYSFTSSFATNFTLGGSLVSLLISSSLLPDYPHFMTKQNYIAFSLLFAASMVIAPQLYVFFSKPTASTGGSVSYVGSVLLFLLTASISVWAVLGQLTLVGLLFGEFWVRGYVATANIWVVNFLLCIAGVGLFVYAWTSAKFSIESHTGAIHKQDAADRQIAPTELMTWKVF